MKALLILGLCLWGSSVLADALPVITGQPQSQAVVVNGAAAFAVTAIGATGYQWRFNGVDIPGATAATLLRNSVQRTNAGYYMVVVRNDTGSVPSQLGYLSVLGGDGVVPFSNIDNTNFQGVARSQYTAALLTNGIAQVVAGPELDQMQPIGDPWDFSEYASYPDWAGYFDMLNQLVPDVAPGQPVYYRVDLTYQNPYGTNMVTQPSTTLKLLAGGRAYPVPSVTNLKFPTWPEWPEPWWLPPASAPDPSTATNQIRNVGETFSLTNNYLAYTDFGFPTCQWRKDGNPIPGAINFVSLTGASYPNTCQTVLTITNVQPEDAGIYDVMVLGNNWMIRPVITLSVLATASGTTIQLQFPRLMEASLVCDLLGPSGKSYVLEESPDLATWSNISTQYNSGGTLTFTNLAVGNGPQFYRARQLP